MQQVPSWIIEIVEVEKLTCRRCSKLFKPDNLMSISIQESHKQPHSDTLCIGLYCPNCKDMTLFEIREMSLIELAFDIMDQETDGPTKKKNKKKTRPAIAKKATAKSEKKSKITAREVQESVKFLQDHNHEEFLSAMGMSPEEIKKYTYKSSGVEKDNG